MNIGAAGAFQEPPDGRRFRTSCSVTQSLTPFRVAALAITDGSPNGDPDAGNMPRIDPETGQRIVTDVCLKRKIRNYVGVAKGEQPPFEIYVKEKAILNKQHDRAWRVVQPTATTAQKKNLPKDEQKARELTKFMCSNFYDVRAFGAVMMTAVNCGQVRGPVQLGLARSLHPVVTQELTVTRCAVRNALSAFSTACSQWNAASPRSGGSAVRSWRAARKSSLAFRIHARVSESRVASCGMQQNAFPNYRGRKRRPQREASLEIAAGADQHVNGRAGAPQHLVRQTATAAVRRRVVGYDEEQVVVAVEPRVGTRARSEQIHARGSVRRDEPPEHLGQCRIKDRCRRGRRVARGEVAVTSVPRGSFHDGNLGSTLAWGQREGAGPAPDRRE